MKISLLKPYYLIMLFLWVAAENLPAQVSASNRLEYQLGNLPDEKPENRSSLYNQFNLQYQQNDIQIGLRVEYNTVSGQAAEYDKLSQKYVRYYSDALQITIGNFYEILGRGLLLRSYEIPGVTYDEPGSRQRYGFYKDIEGLSVRYQNDFLQARFLYGRPLDLLQPPSQKKSERRPNLVQGGEINFSFLDQFVPGMLFLRRDKDGQTKEYNGLNFSGTFDWGSQYYAEYVQESGSANPAFKFGKASRHAFYASFSQTFDRVSLSGEYKDYHNFTINFNDPPPLVREHARTLLNRSTHPVQPEDERGYQIEGIFNIGEMNTFTLNYARAINETPAADFTMYEYYAELHYYLGERTLIKPFADWAEDELLGEINRLTGGVALEQQLNTFWSTYLDIQFQQFDREFEFAPNLDHKTTSALFDLAVARSALFSLGINLETSNDPLETDSLFELDDSNYKYWLGYNFSYQYGQNHTIALFYGERRGGNACSGGICYEVQPFKGIELRINSIF